MKYKSKPVEIDAWQVESLEGTHTRRLPPSWVFEALATKQVVSTPKGLCIYSNEHASVLHAENGDWLIKGTEGELYPCVDSVFQRKYELAKQSLVGSEHDR